MHLVKAKIIGSTGVDRHSAFCIAGIGAEASLLRRQPLAEGVAAR